MGNAAVKSHERPLHSRETKAAIIIGFKVGIFVCIAEDESYLTIFTNGLANTVLIGVRVTVELCGLRETLRLNLMDCFLHQSGRVDGTMPKLLFNLLQKGWIDRCQPPSNRPITIGPSITCICSVDFNTEVQESVNSAQ